MLQSRIVCMREKFKSLFKNTNTELEASIRSVANGNIGCLVASTPDCTRPLLNCILHDWCLLVDLQYYLTAPIPLTS
jgi:hypothetical protein